MFDSAELARTIESCGRLALGPGFGGAAPVEDGDLAGLTADDLAGLSADELRDAVLGLERARSALDALEGRALAELEVRDACDQDLGLSTTSWLTARAALPRAVAGARVRTGVKLRTTLPEVDRALAEGRIRFDHARALAEAANPRLAVELAAGQEALVALAEAAPYRVWRSELARLVELLDQDGGFDPAREQARNWLRLTPVGPDQVQVSGELVGEIALAVTQAMQRAADRAFRRYQRDQQEGADTDLPGRATLMAEGWADLARKAEAVDPSTTRAPSPDVTVVLHLAADADGRPAGAGPSAGSDPADPPAVPLTTIDGQALRHERYERLLCDAGFHALLADSLGLPLDLGRTVRLATPAQRRAVALRDGGCVFPGCDAPMNWCDIHHVDEFDHGGRTDLANLAPLCRHHHGVTHRRGWQMVAQPDHTFIWTTPAGRVLPSQRRRRSATGHPDPAPDQLPGEQAA